VPLSALKRKKPLMSSKVTEDKVREACDAIVNRGERLTFDAVYDEVGRKGSATLVMGFLRAYRAANGIRITRGAQRDSGSADFIQEVGHEFLERLWSFAVAFADGQMSKREEALEQTRQAMEHDLAQARATAEASAQVATAAQQEATSARAQTALLQTHLDEMRALYERTERQRDTARAEIGRLTVELQQCLAARQTEATEADRRIEKLLTKAAADLALERERSNGERQVLMKQTDQQRNEFTTQLAELKKQLAKEAQRCETLLARAEGAQKELREAKTLAREQEVRLSALEERSTRLQLQRDELQQASSKSLAAQTALQARLAALEERRGEDAQRLAAQESRIEVLHAQLHAWQVAAAAGRISSPDALKGLFEQ